MEDAKALVEKYQQAGFTREDIKLTLQQQGFSSAAIEDALKNVPTIDWDASAIDTPVKKKSPNIFSIITGIIMVCIGAYRYFGNGINSTIGSIFIVLGILNIVNAFKSAR
jgi:hypothetical protein